MTKWGLSRDAKLAQYVKTNQCNLPYNKLKKKNHISIAN